MSDINAAHVACMQRLSNEGEANKDNNQEHGDDDGDDDKTEEFMKQYRESRQQRREEEKRMQKVRIFQYEQCDNSAVGGNCCDDFHQPMY